MFSRVLLATALFYFLHTIPKAHAGVCDTISDYINYNATNTYPIAALSVSSPDSDPVISLRQGQSWNLTTRIYQSPGNDTASELNTINIASSNLTGMGFCAEQIQAYDINEFDGAYTFPKAVLERSVDDKGDCKVMLGDRCVEALKSKYELEATKYALSGECTNPNTTVPYECADLISGSDHWFGATSIWGPSNMSRTFADQTSEYNCSVSTTEDLSTTIGASFALDGAYNQMLRFPRPTFFTFWPNRTGDTEVSSSDIHVEIMCLRPDQVREGSMVPPSAQDLLGRGDVRYAAGLRDPEGPKEDEDKPGAAGRIHSGWMLITAALGASLLMV